MTSNTTDAPANARNWNFADNGASERFTPERVASDRRLRFNPIRHLSPESLSRALDAFHLGYLRPAAFALPAAGTFGNIGKGSLRGPHMVNWDTGLFKEFPLSAERLRLQFRAEFFNVLNRTNFANPGGSNSNPNSPTTSVSSGGFGTLTAAQDPRIGQLALKFIF